MIVQDGYTIEYYQNANRIAITLPQTMRTLTNTASMVVNRRIDITNEELSAVLVIVRALLEKGEQE